MQKAFISLYLENRPLIADDVAAIQRWMFLKHCLHMRAYQPDHFIAPSTNGQSLLEEQSVEIKRMRMRQYEEIWRSYRETNSVPSDYRFFLSKGLNPKLTGIFNYVPVEAFVLEESGEFVILSSHLTFLFAMGDFQGVVTNDPILANTISGAIQKGKNEKLAYELIDGARFGPIQDAINFIDFEDYILTNLEVRTGHILRRSNVSLPGPLAITLT